MIFQTFYEGRLGPQELSCLTSFVKNGHTVNVYSYSYKDLPPFINGMDAEEILPKNKMFSINNGDHRGSYAIFSDIFRWNLLKLKGGIWIDTDVICISNDWPEDEIFFGYQDGTIINNAIMKFPMGHELLIEAASISQNIWENCSWGETGPLLLTSLVEKYGLQKFAKKESIFYPAQFWWAENIRDEVVSEQKIDEFLNIGSVSVHLWNECLRTKLVNKNIYPKIGSLLDRILKKYNMSSFYTEYEIKNELKKLINY